MALHLISTDKTSSSYAREISHDRTDRNLTFFSPAPPAFSAYALTLTSLCASIANSPASPPQLSTELLEVTQGVHPVQQGEVREPPLRHTGVRCRRRIQRPHCDARNDLMNSESKGLRLTVGLDELELSGNGTPRNYGVPIRPGIRSMRAHVFR